MYYSFKDLLAKRWSVTDDKIIIGNKTFLLSDVVKIDNVNIPNSRMQTGTVGVTTADGKWHILQFPFSQKAEAIKAIEYIKRHSKDEVSKLLAELEHREFRMRCKVCGKVTCFTMSDLRTNQKLARQAAVTSGVSVVNALFGTMYNAYEQGKIADRLASRVVDYTKCPSCNSTDIEMLTDEQWAEAISVKESPALASTADEILKYKNLLDGGIITQEEFDAKKKQLLGL